MSSKNVLVPLHHTDPALVTILRNNLLYEKFVNEKYNLLWYMLQNEPLTWYQAICLAIVLSVHCYQINFIPTPVHKNECLKSSTNTVCSENKVNTILLFGIFRWRFAISADCRRSRAFRSIKPFCSYIIVFQCLVKGGV